MQLAIKSEEFDPSHRVEAFQDVVSNICKLEIRPDQPEEFRSATTIGVMPDLITGRGVHSASLATRTRQLAADSGDNVMFHIPISGSYSMEQDGGERYDLKPGLVYFDPNEVAGTVRFHGEATDAFYVSIPRSHLASATKGLNTVLKGTSEMTPQWRLFMNYTRTLHEELPSLAPEEAASCVSHVQDLALMALGATREAAEIAAGRGVRAARLAMVKADIENNLTSEDLSASWIAGRNGLSPRYIRALFEREGTSFGDYVAARRLAAAYRMLSDPAYALCTIAQIAMDTGFGDLSWFNVRFKRMFGMTPGDVRAKALSQR